MSIADTAPAEPVPVAWLGRTSTAGLQDPVSSLRRQLRAVHEKLPAGWFIAAHFWDVESGGLDLDQRGHGNFDHLNVGIPRDGGIAAMMSEAASPKARFAAVMCEDIARSSRDTYSALRLEKKLSAAGIPLLAADEPIDIAGTSATTILVRRMKQSVAEWYRFELKEKSWAGFQEHSLEGFNTGPAPYGYAGHRIPHPAPSKAAEGRTKTRLMIDPGRAPVVAQIFAWRVYDRLGMNTIASRLNTNPAAYPPPGKAGCWQVSVVARILGNPKYTGYMVYGRTRTSKGKRGHKVPADQWLWSPQPAHPAIITRDLWDTAQASGQAHGSSRDEPGLSTHPAARYNYALRGIVRCRECNRRMTGHRKTSRAGAAPVAYYGCTHDPANPRHTTAYPDHPATVRARETLLQAILAQFFDTRIFGPDRAALAAAAIPAPADAHRRRDTDIAAIKKKLRKIDASEDAHAREIEHLTRLDADPRAITALRTRLIARFTELEQERDHLNTQLARLTTTAPAAPDPTLLDNLPRLAGILADAPVQLQQDLYRTFGIQILYNPDGDQVTCYATITPATPTALTAIINTSEPPHHATTSNVNSTPPPALAVTTTPPALSVHAPLTTSGRPRCRSRRKRERRQERGSTDSKALPVLVAIAPARNRPAVPSPLEPDVAGSANQAYRCT
jgi:site-specific DNA recombinase